jgi:uncharacterized membrane protein YdjX (TVP38/TMEM64 family)
LQLGLGFSLALVLALVIGPLKGPTLLQSSLVWVQDQGRAGVVAFVVIYNLATMLLVPGMVLTLGGGVLYGVVWGSVYVALASILGAALAFLVGRYLARGMVCRYLGRYPQFQALNAAVAKAGFKIVLLTRLSPLLPFNLLNYGFGLTQVSFRDYVLGSVGMIPGTVLYVYLGAVAGDIATLGSATDPSAQPLLTHWGLRLGGLAITGGTTAAIAHIAKQALNQSITDSLTNTDEFL